MAKPKEKAAPTNGRRARGGVRDIRITDVAALAQVSPITVSRALNNPEVVAPDTLRRIQQTVQQLGYVPNRLAGSLSSSKSRLIAAIVPTVSHSLFSTSIQAFSDAMSRAGYQVLLGLSGYSEDDELRVLDAALSRRPEGVLLVGVARTAPLRARLLSLQLPTVETWDTTDLPVDMLVGFSHYDIGVAVAQHFIARGWRRPAIVSANDARARARHDGFLQTMARNGIADVADISVAPPSSVELGRASLTRILDARPDIDCVFCGSDLLALGVLGEARSRGIKVPDNLAVCGFGDLEFAAELRPALTSVRVDGKRIGTAAADCLIARLRGASAESNVDVGFTIVARDTA
ncbi:LacI family DNA-binding transcriptional regulator [Paraburkholderia caballeronis]|uniref:Transcriptional regulator, LacI family n=1 Tax=Paraburkholderia caballeronis TaxID=416943 RepID=A0A1H7SFC7_9BURK|nr:LacI family DNA-binding transcriptional regulator [Paraburkholderia caballeronis]PXW22280.1 LacI family transcriptional regulator [Paraburkholderia caballeronis]PXW95939.1 LacI family transcriptional regulator [Paraburkholderia caballeronis]RAJ92305.1 LacI family transcriptional regulator [Paraburkholderia caballeronis]TDV08129.1 LacI family transcriptional regulator [Paraburkholderia caballeronis]TDV11807.1 LacI family transcriptional regulator [Paraburkholderia caballeronis]